MSSKILKAAVLASLLATPLMASADRAPGEMKGDWLIRAGMGATFHVPVEIDVPPDTLPARYARIACLDTLGQAVQSAGFREFHHPLIALRTRRAPNLQNTVRN